MFPPLLPPPPPKHTTHTGPNDSACRLVQLHGELVLASSFDHDTAHTIRLSNTTFKRLDAPGELDRCGNFDII